MRFAIGAPTVASFAEPDFLVQLAKDAEDSGWDGFFVWDHILYRPPERAAVEPWSIVAAAAAITSRVRIGVMVTALPRRSPSLMAQQVATIDQLSEGRVVFGAGLGSMADEYVAFGEDPNPRVRARKLDEGLDVLRSLWSGKPTSYSGECYRIEAPAMNPLPRQRPRPPIWIAGRWPHRAPFRRAARFDGMMPTHANHLHGSFMSVEEFAPIVEYVTNLRDGDDPFEVVMEGESQGPESLAELADRYAAVGATWWVEKLGWWRGDLETARRRVEAGPPP